ncbi:MAG: FGGY-family carbohydrate kinase [Lapillicoccus sp.]
MSAETVVLGIDLATAGARCVALDAESGAVLAQATGALAPPVRSGRGSSTQEATYAAVALDLVRQVCAALGASAARIRAVSVTGTSGTVVPVDAAGTPVGDARLYDDLSGADTAVSQGISPSSMLGRMHSLLPVTGVRRMVPTVDVVAAALVGAAVASDTSHTLKAGIDLTALTWPVSRMEALGLPTDDLPSLVPPGTILGVVSAAVATRLGLPTDVLVIAGMTDGCTAQLSTGAIHAGDSMGVLGTTLVLKGVSDHDIRTDDGAVYSHLSPAGDYWPGGASSSGAGVIAATFPGIGPADLADMDQRAADRGPATVVAYPLARTGERFPVADPGLTSLTSGEPVDEVDAYRAILEGVAFIERLGLETLAGLGAPTRRHTLTGGASGSRVWNTLRATVIGGPRSGVPVVRIPLSGSAIGAAVLAAHGLMSSTTTGATPTPFATTVGRLVARGIDVEPDLDESEELEDSYREFVALLDHHRSTAASAVGP